MRMAVRMATVDTIFKKLKSNTRDSLKIISQMDKGGNNGQTEHYLRDNTWRAKRLDMVNLSGQMATSTVVSWLTT